MKEDNNPQNDDGNGKDAKNKKTSKVPKDQQFPEKDNHGQLKGSNNSGNLFPIRNNHPQIKNIFKLKNNNLNEKAL